MDDLSPAIEEESPWDQFDSPSPPTNIPEGIFNDDDPIPAEVSTLKSARDFIKRRVEKKLEKGGSPAWRDGYSEGYIVGRREGREEGFSKGYSAAMRGFKDSSLPD